RVEVAEEPEDAGLLEGDVSDRRDEVDLQVATRPVEEREDVVEHAIVVWKIHHRAHPYGEHMGRKAQIALIEHDLLRWRARRRIRGLQPDDGICLGPFPRPRDAAKVEVSGPSCRSEQQ